VAKPLDQGIADKLVADWRTGEYTVRDLAHKHKVSHGTAGKLCKGIDKDNAHLVDKGVSYLVGLSELDGQLVDAIKDIVDSKARNIQFFANAAVKNVAMAVGKLTDETTQFEHKLCADTISKGRDTVLGKEPAVQIDNKEGGQMVVNIMRFTDDPNGGD
jgi:hypothetical protein